MDAPAPAQGNYWRQQIENALLAPIRAMRLAYLPLLMVYFAYGATGLTAVAQTFWVKRDLTYTPAELASLSVWFTLPWTIKMVFGELVDTVPLLSSQRACVRRRRPDRRRFRHARCGCRPVVPLDASRYAVRVGLAAERDRRGAQDVVADAMSTGWCRVNADGSPRAKAEIVMTRHGAGAGPPGAGLRHLLGRRPVRMAGADRVVSSGVLWGLVVPLVSISVPCSSTSSPAKSGRPTGASWAVASPTVQSWCCSA
jgi:hypothetical protein